MSTVKSYSIILLASDDSFTTLYTSDKRGIIESMFKSPFIVYNINGQIAIFAFTIPSFSLILI